MGHKHERPATLQFALGGPVEITVEYEAEWYAAEPNLGTTIGGYTITSPLVFKDLPYLSTAEIISLGLTSEEVFGSEQHATTVELEAVLHTGGLPGRHCKLVARSVTLWSLDPVPVDEGNLRDLLEACT